MEYYYLYEHFPSNTTAVIKSYENIRNNKNVEVYLIIDLSPVKQSNKKWIAYSLDSYKPITVAEAIAYKMIGEKT